MDDNLTALVDSAADAIVTADANGQILSWNRSAERIFGYTTAEVVHRSLTMLMPERFRAAHDEGIARVRDGGPMHVIGRTVELAGLRKNGGEFPIELSLSTWSHNGVRYFAGIIRDVTERNRLVDAVKASEAQLAAVLRSATDAVICADQRGIITLWNLAAERLLGYAGRDTVGQPLTIIVPERFHDAHNAGILRASRGEPPRILGTTVEVYARRRDGSEFPVELSLASWTVGDERFYSGVLRDISERREAAERIAAANEALAEKNQQLEALSAKLAKYLSRQVYDAIFAGRTEVRVQSYRKLLTVFFSDIQGFTTLTDMLEAELLSELLNEYLGEMSAIATRFGGTVDKFIGDGVMIFFGDPETRGHAADAVACVQMALAMQERVRALQREWNDRGIQQPLHVRMGINTGYCTVGNFGSEERLDYTIVGGQVNAAARLEASAQPDQILVSHQTWALIKDRIECRRIGEITVKGIAHPLLTYEAVALRDEVAVPDL